MSIRLATHVTRFSSAAESSRSADVQGDINLETVIKHGTKQYLKCSVDWYQPMHKHRANDEPQIGFWSTTEATDSRGAIKPISWPEKNFKRAKTHCMGLQPFYGKRPHPLLCAGPRACSWKNSNKWNTCLICCNIFKVYTIHNCGRGSETHDAVGTRDTELL
jgi:hypothetical protein